MALPAPTARRRDIEAAASVLFRERGYAATSVRDIAGALDLRGPSLYAHVTSKEDVLWAIVDGAANRFEEAAAAALLDSERVAPGDHAAACVALVRAHVGVVTADIGAASVFVSEWRSLSADRRALVVARRDAYERGLRALLADGMAVGAFRMIDPALAATFILTALNAIPSWYRPDGRTSPSRLADEFADLALSVVTEVLP